MADVAVALDVTTAADALRVVDAAGDLGTWFKVGPVLHVREGPRFVEQLLARGKRVFLDLKWHDIPHTVAGAVAAASRLGVHLVTVHQAGGTAMLEAAAGAREGGLRVVGVGVLTSLDAAAYGGIVGRPVEAVAREQERFAAQVLASGLDGMVTAAAEAAVVRAVLGPERLVVVPGIRRPGEAPGDQARTATPSEAVRAGADLLVVGRPVTGAASPAAALREIREAMAW